MQTRNNLFDPVVGAFLGNGDRYNLLNSAVLELFEFVRKDNVKDLVAHLAEVCHETIPGPDCRSLLRVVHFQVGYTEQPVRKLAKHRRWLMALHNSPIGLFNTLQHGLET